MYLFFLLGDANAKQKNIRSVHRKIQITYVTQYMMMMMMMTVDDDDDNDNNKLYRVTRSHAFKQFQVVFSYISVSTKFVR